MKNNLQLLRSALSVAAGIVITVLISVLGETTIIGNGVLTFEKLRLIWVPPVLAAVVGGYLTAWIAPHSGVRHAMAVAGIFVLLIAFLALRAAEPPIQTAMTSLALTVCILLGAIGRDWQLHRSRGYAA